MAAYLRHNPGDAFFFRVKLDNGEPVAEDLDRAAHENVQIRIALAAAAGPAATPLGALLDSGAS